MEKRIELEKRRLSPSQVTELTLDNCRSTSIEGLTEEFVNLRSLSLIGVGLTSLKGLPKLPKLEKLELSENRISGGLQALKVCERLKMLNLSANKITDMESVEPLKEIKTLKSLDLCGNLVSTLDDYREQMFALLPELTYLDGLDRNGKDSESDVEEEEKEVNGKDDDEDDVEEEEVDLNAAVVGNEDGVEEEDDDDSDESDDDCSEEEEGDTAEIGLKDIYRNDLDQESDSDYENENQQSSEEDDVLLSSDPESADVLPSPAGEPRRGTKRPHEGDESA